MLMIRLLKSDKKLKPKKIKNKDGSIYYSYTKRYGEEEITLEEIEKRIFLGSDFYKKDRENVINLLEKINAMGINNKLESIESGGTLGLWIPSKELIIIDTKVVNMGSKVFLEILRHEAIHVAQSCNGKSRNDFPKRIGLPLDFSRDINFNLSNKIYHKNSE